MSDNCGASIGVSSRGVGDVSGLWLPPAAGATCLVTARAVNSDGLASTLSLAVLARPGTPTSSQPPQVFAEYESGCVFGGSFTTFCGSFTAGSTRTVFIEAFLQDGHPARSRSTTTAPAGSRSPRFPTASSPRSRSPRRG